MGSLAERWVSGTRGMNIPGVSPEAARRNRITNFEERADRFPGVMGNGPTGVTDARGWSDMLQDRQGYENDMRAEEGKGPMDVRYGGTIQERPESGGGNALQGLRMAMRGGNYAGGGGEDVDDNGAGRTQRLANAVRQRDLEEELTNPSSARPDLGTNLSPEELHAASAHDFMTKSKARTAGETYYMPEVAGPREDEQAMKMAQIIRQYVDPANIKADADVASAELGYEGQRARATGQENAARFSGAANVRAADINAGGRRATADSSLLGNFAQYGIDDPKAMQQFMGLIKAMREQGVIK